MLINGNRFRHTASSFLKMLYGDEIMPDGDEIMTYGGEKHTCFRK